MIRVLLGTGFGNIGEISGKGNVGRIGSRTDVVEDVLDFVSVCKRIYRQGEGLLGKASKEGLGQRIVEVNVISVGNVRKRSIVGITASVTGGRAGLDFIRNIVLGS